MIRIPVSSSNIRDIGYDATTLTLEIGFRDGGVYQYFGVPSSVYHALMAASSHGSYLASHIKGRYRYRRVG